VKRIVCLSIFFAALIEFSVERARFDLWIISVAVALLLWDTLSHIREASGKAVLRVPPPHDIIQQRSMSDRSLNDLAGKLARKSPS
jgi:hypothetical protein